MTMKHLFIAALCALAFSLSSCKETSRPPSDPVEQYVGQWKGKTTLNTPETKYVYLDKEYTIKKIEETENDDFKIKSWHLISPHKILFDGLNDGGLSMVTALVSGNTVTLDQFTEFDIKTEGEDFTSTTATYNGKGTFSNNGKTLTMSGTVNFDYNGVVKVKVEGQWSSTWTKQ